ncbi:MAG: elongation factor G [Sulfuricella sp.]|jgi:elongation factor G
MPNDPVTSIRTLALAGHGASGKTTLAESLLFKAGAIASQGSVEKGSTVCDFDALEKDCGHSLNSAVVNFFHQGQHIYLIDTPGYPDYSGQAIGALAAVDTAVVVINAQAGIELATRRMMKAAAARGLCRMIVVNKIDAENLDLPGLLADIQASFGKECLPINLPAHGRQDVVDCFFNPDGDADFSSVREAHTALIDQVVEVDEDLMAIYLEQGEELSPEQLHAPFEKALREGHLVPVCFTAAKSGTGVGALLDVIARLAPNPSEGNAPPFLKGEGASALEFHAEPDAGKHVLAHVFKVIIDPYVGKMGVFRVHQGTLRRDAQLFIGNGKRPFKAGHLYLLQGKDYVETDILLPGDIGAVAKAEEIEFDAVLHDSHDEDHIHLRPLDFPKPMHGLAVETRRKGDEQRLFEILHKLEMEDPTFMVERHPATNETVIRGLGELHLRAKLDKMAQAYKLEVDTRPPRIPYRETIASNAEGHYRHKKQSGGAGQFGEVFLRIEALPRGTGYEFVDAVKGGTIPGVFMPAVEKGVKQALEAGVIAGYPVQDIRVVVYDGKHHPVDSKEVAFVVAGRKAVIAAVKAASPILLEPIVNIEILGPESAIGDLAADIAGKRGHVTGTQPRGSNTSAISAEVPLAELNDYQSRLRSLTSGQGAYALEFSRYAAVPPAVQQALMSQFKAQEEDD